MTSTSSEKPRHLTGGIAEWEHAHIFPAEAGFRYSEGFKSAAEVLVDHVYASGDPTLWADSLLYPICYLLRHYIELKIKGILRELERGLKPGHKLLPLWETMCEVAEPYLGPQRDEAEQGKVNERLDPFVSMRDHESFIGLQEAREIVAELHDLDPTGEAFRYAHTIAGQRSLPDNLTHLDLKRFLGRVLSVGILLDGIATAIDECRRTEAEMRQEYADEMQEYYSG